MAHALETFRATHIYETDATAADVMLELGAICAVGQQLDAARSRFKTLFFIMFVPAIITLIVGVQFAVTAPGVAFGAMFIVVGFAVFCAFRWRALAKQSYELRMGAMLERTLNLISRDMASDAKIHVKLDLRPHEDPAKLARTGEVHHWQVKFYVDPWLRLTGRLLDGTAFRLAAATHWQARRRWAKSSSGKSKLKTKKKEATIMSLRLKFKPRRYPHAGDITDAKKAVQVPQGVAVRRVNTTADSLLLAVKFAKWNNAPPAGSTAEMVSGPHAAAMMFLSAYQVLNLAKEIEKVQKAGGGK